MPFDPLQHGPGKGKVGTAYISPGQVAMGLAGDTSLASYLPNGVVGGGRLGGTVIPHHKPGRGGGSMGYNPHKPAHKHVMIDPHVPGRAVALDLAKITPDTSTSAFESGTEFADEVMADPPEQMDGIVMKGDEGPRLRAYAASRILAENFGAAPDGPFGRPAPKAKPEAPQIVQPVAVEPAVRVVPGGTAKIGQSMVHGGNPMARFHPTPAPPQAAPAAQVITRPPIRGHESAPPSVRVVFDFGNQLGQFPAQYHDVIRAKGALIFVWDTRWPHAEPYSPESLPESLQFAVQVQDHDEVYLVVSTGETFTFEYDGRRFFHVGIIDRTAAD